MGTCPFGGLWYTCTAQIPTFLGCCTSNPCQGNGKTCPASDLRAAGMGTGPGPDPGLTSNDASYWPNVQCSVGQWWTCAVQIPSFQGCCEENPCGGDGTGCPASLLHPAEFSTVTSDVAAATTLASVSSTMVSTITGTPAASPASISIISTTSSASTDTTAPSAAGDSIPEKTSSSLPIGAIGGGAGGGIAILVIGLVIFCLCRRRRLKKSFSHSDVLPTMGSRPNNNSSYMVKVDEFHQPQTSPEVYYPNQTLFGLQNAAKYTQVQTSSSPVSPGPPPYQSPQASPNPNLHEIDSSNVATSGCHDRIIQPVSRSRKGSDLGEDGIAELPTAPAAENRWRSKRPSATTSVEIGEGSLRELGISPESDGRNNAVYQSKKGRESYVSWQSLSQ